jgi:hypothetical protein
LHCCAYQKFPNKSLTIIIIYSPNGSNGPGILTRYLSKSKSICMNQSKLFLAALFAIVTGLYSCSKTGNTGATGATGTANVLYSNWSALNMTYNLTDSAYEQTITADSVTQAVLDSGLVLCYIKYTNAASQTQVESADSSMETVLGVKSITLYSYTYNFTGTDFRYIVVHGGVNINGRSAAPSATIRGYTKAEWKAMSYDKVVAVLEAN